MIIVTGATGTIGSGVVRQLAARGETVRALTRDPAGAELPAGVEAVRGHHRDRVSVAAAMDGAGAAFLVGVFGADDGEHDRGLVEAARAAGVRRVVKLSSTGTGDPAVGAFGTWHVPGERAVQESGLEWTILRPATFASNTLGWAAAVQEGSPVPNAYGDGKQGMVDPRDIAEVAVASLLDARHAGRTYTLTGPEALSTPEQIGILADVLGRPIDRHDLSADEERAHLRALGLDEAFLDASAFIRGGGTDVVTRDVPEVLGRPARSYREWARDHRGLFGGA